MIQMQSKTKIEVAMYGQGKPLLLIPGFGMTAPIWSYQIRDWGSENRIIIINKPGHGQSEMCVNVSPSYISRQIFDVLSKLKVSWPIHLIGTSLGGLVVQHFAKDYPEKVLTLTLSGSGYQLLDPIAMKEMLDEEIVEFLAALMDKELNNIKKKIRKNNLYKDEESFDLIKKSKIIDPFVALKYKDQVQVWSTMDILHEINIPTLIICGTNDAIVDPGESRVLHSKIENSMYYEIQGAGHFPYVTHYKEFNKKVMEFIKEYNDK